MRKLALATTVALALMPELTQADVTSAWVAQLSRDGYKEITVSRTWLGRVRITAERGAVEREIVINPRTGEVLRDYSRHEDGSSKLPFGSDQEDGEEDEGDAEQDADDDDGDDDEDDAGDDDNGDDEGEDGDDDD